MVKSESISWALMILFIPIWTSDHNQKPANRAPRVWITLFHASQHRHVPAAVSAWNAKRARSNQVLVQIYLMYHCQSPSSISRIMKIIFCLFEVLVQDKTSLTAQEVPTGEEEEAKWNDRYFVQSWLKNASSCPLFFLKESCADLPSKSLELEAFFRNSNLKHV